LRMGIAGRLINWAGAGYCANLFASTYMEEQGKWLL
jgi:hypothetical protein